MTRPSATCELWVDGTRVADTGYVLESHAATALEGLKITWGRDGQNEQPGPASCSFQIVDPIGEDNALDVIHVGSDVEVWAEGHVETGTGWGPTTFDDGSFSTKADGPVPPNDVAFNQGTGTYEGQALRFFPKDPWIASSGTGVTVPPRAYSPVNTLPDAWDDIPRARQGEIWRIVASVRAPVGMGWYLAVTAHPSPYVGAAPSGYNTRWVVYPGMQTGTGDWQTWDGQILFTLLSQPSWLAVTVKVSGDPFARARWNNQPPAMAWAAAPGAWNDWSRYGADLYVDNLAVYPPAETIRRVLAFSGEISDITLEPYGNGVSTMITSTAMDLGARLGNTVIGDNPWPVQTVAVRSARIATLAGITSQPVRIDAPLDALQVSYRDVDAQPSYALLQDLAQTAGGVLWVATHAITGPFLWIENPAARTAVREFDFVGSAPVVDATNLAVNPISDSGNVSTWWSPTRATAAVNSGFLRMTVTDATVGDNAQRIVTPTGGVNRMLVTPGETVQAAGQMRSGGSWPMRCIIQWYNAAQAFISQSTGVPVTTDPSAWTDLTMFGVAPANTDYYVVQFGIAGTGPRAIGDTFDLRHVMINKGAASVPYFDGSTPAAPPYSYRWTGAVNASTSERLTGGGTIKITTTRDPGRGAAVMSACDVLEDGVAWRQDTADVVTVVAVTWLEQGVDDDGQPATTERTETVTDTAALATYGTRRLSVGTELIAATDANAMAGRILSTAREIQWRLDGLTFDTRKMMDTVESVTDSNRELALLNMLDGTSRMGLALTLTDMPDYAPGGAVPSVYLEGGSYEFADGDWVLTLTTTPATGQGASATWGDFAPTGWKWNQWDPAMQWGDTYGVVVG